MIENFEINRTGWGIFSENNSEFKFKYIISTENSLIGVCSIIKYTNSDPIIEGFYVYDNYRRQGFGRKIITHLIKDFFNFDSKYESIYLFADTGNIKALNLYTDLGFVVCDKRENSRIIKMKLERLVYERRLSN